MNSIVIPQGQDSVVRISAKRRSTVALPSSMTIWGKIYGNINDQADLMAKFAQMEASIQEAKDWAVVGWVL